MFILLLHQEVEAGGGGGVFSDDSSLNLHCDIYTVSVKWMTLTRSAMFEATKTGYFGW